jgi:hypothetical protein
MLRKNRSIEAKQINRKGLFYNLCFGNNQPING